MTSVKSVCVGSKVEKRALFVNMRTSHCGDKLRHKILGGVLVIEFWLLL